MKIETKFDIGDYVYKLDAINRCFRITGVTLSIKGVFYSGDFEGGIVNSYGKEEELGLIARGSSETGSAPLPAAEVAPAPQPHPHDPISGTPKKRPWYRRG